VTNTGVEGAVERLTKAAADSGTVGGPFTWTVGVFAEDLRAILTDREALLARIATMEGESEKDGEAFEDIATMGWSGAPDIPMRHIARARLEARQSREGAE
jgi:hypothetical protein